MGTSRRKGGPRCIRAPKISGRDCGNPRRREGSRFMAAIRRTGSDERRSPRRTSGSRADVLWPHRRAGRSGLEGIWKRHGVGPVMHVVQILRGVAEEVDQQSASMFPPLSRQQSHRSLKKWRPSAAQHGDESRAEYDRKMQRKDCQRASHRQWCPRTRLGHVGHVRSDLQPAQAAPIRLANQARVLLRFATDSQEAALLRAFTSA
jgi:hypothetical protein